MNLEEKLGMKELQKMGIKVDFLPKEFPIGGQFLMNNIRYAHVGKQKCVMIVFDDEIITTFKA